MMCHPFIEHQIAVGMVHKRHCPVPHCRRQHLEPPRRCHHAMRARIGLSSASSCASALAKSLSSCKARSQRLRAAEGPPPPRSGRDGSEGPGPRVGIETVAVYFRNDDILQEASPGESLASVASRSGVDIPYGCHTGKCGVCEVELRKFGPAGGAADEAGAPVVVRACVDVVPRGWQRIEIDFLEDAIWGLDGWDT